jgi:hypothetical protein
MTAAESATIADKRLMQSNKIADAKFSVALIINFALV